MEKRKGIFFDIGWTLMRPKREWFLTDLFYSLVPEADKYQSKIEQAMVSAMWILDQNHRMDTLEQEETQFRQFYSSLLSAIPELKLGDDAAVALAHDKVYNYQNYVFFPDAVPVLSDLKTEYKIGIISDTWPSAECFLKEAGLYDLFDSFTFSYQLDVFKPDPKMYQDAIQKLGIPATNTFFVDDSAECLAGAAMLGITPIQIMKKPDNIQLEEALHINTLNELPRLLTTY